jgi:hypothetical protein
MTPVNIVSLPGLPVEYGTILHDRLASGIRRDGSHRYAHYAEQIGRASEGCGGDETVGRGAFQFRFSKPRRKTIIGASVCLRQEIVSTYGMDYDIQTTYICLKTRTLNPILLGQ